MDTDSSLSARHRTADVRPRAAAPGIALAVGGAMVVASEVVMLGLETGSVSAAGITTKIVRLAAFLLVLLGLPGLYALRRHGTGRIWGAAYVTAYLGTALIAGDLWFEAFAYPFLIEAAPALTELTPSGTFIAGALASLRAVPVRLGGDRYRRPAEPGVATSSVGAVDPGCRGRISFAAVRASAGPVGSGRGMARPAHGPE